MKESKKSGKNLKFKFPAHPSRFYVGKTKSVLGMNTTVQGSARVINIKLLMSLQVFETFEYLMQAM